MKVFSRRGLISRIFFRPRPTLLELMIILAFFVDMCILAERYVFIIVLGNNVNCYFISNDL